jgi:hypothetical protein
MDYGTAFTFITKEDNWIGKAVMAAVFVLLMPFLGLGSLLLVGWSIAVARHVINGEKETLPDWSELGQIFVDGLKMAVVFFIWAIPAYILSGIGALVSSDVVSVCLGLIGFVYAFVLILLAPPVLGQLAAGASFGQVLNPANSYRLLMAKLAETVIVAALYIIGISLAFTVGLLLCGIGIFATLPYAYGAIGHLSGQLFSEAQGDVAPKAW